MAKPSFIPSIGKKPVTPAAAPAAPVAAPAAVVETPVTEIFDEGTEEMTEEVAAIEKKARKASAGPRKTPNRQMTNEDIVFVVKNIKTMSYTEIAEARGLTKFQVNRVLMKVKKDLREAAGTDPEKMKVVESHIAENLSRPEEAQIGGRGGQVNDGINSVVSDIMASIGI